MTVAPLLLADRAQTAIAMGESHFREFQSALDRSAGTIAPRPTSAIRQDVAEALVAFANADGGELLVGVEGDGTVTGVPHTATKVESLLRTPEERIHKETPLPTVTRATVDLGGDLVLYFAVGKSTEYIHQTADGKCLRRRDSESVPAVPAVLQLEWYTHH